MLHSPSYTFWICFTEIEGTIKQPTPQHELLSEENGLHQLQADTYA
jgi:hypothetical protein